MQAAQQSCEEVGGDEPLAAYTSTEHSSFSYRPVTPALRPRSAHASRYRHDTSSHRPMSARNPHSVVQQVCGGASATVTLHLVHQSFMRMVSVCTCGTSQWQPVQARTPHSTRSTSAKVLGKSEACMSYCAHVFATTSQPFLCEPTQNI